MESCCRLFLKKGDFWSKKCYLTSNFSENRVTIHETPASSKYPQYLVLKEGTIRGSDAILRYFASQKNCMLYGQSVYEQAKVDQWLDELAVLRDVEMCILYQIPSDVTSQYFRKDLKVLQQNAYQSVKIFINDVLENHLSSKTYIVGERLTIADIALYSSWSQILMSDEWKEKCSVFYNAATCPHTVRWYQTCDFQCNQRLKKMIQLRKNLHKDTTPKLADNVDILSSRSRLEYTEPKVYTVTDMTLMEDKITKKMEQKMMKIQKAEKQAKESEKQARIEIAKLMKRIKLFESSATM